MSYYDDDRSRDDRSRGDRGHKQSRAKLNEYWVDGKGIHPDVIHREIARYLGPEAFAKSETRRGVQGYVITAVRPFTSHMLDDLQEKSENYRSGSRRSDRYSGASSHPTSNPAYDQPYPQSPTQPSYGPDITQPGYQPPSRYMPSQPQSGYPLPPTFAPQPGYQPHFDNPSQPRYPSHPDPNYPAAGGFSSSAYSPYQPRDEYQYQLGDNMISNPSSYQTPQAPYGVQGPYGPIDHSPIQPAQSARPPTSSQQPYSTGIPSYSISGHQSPPLTTLHCTECDYSSSRQSDMSNHMQGHFSGASSGGRRSARNG